MVRTTRQGLGLPDRRRLTKAEGRLEKFIPTQKNREQVSLWAAYGKSQEWMANKLKISEDTLLNHFRKEIDEGIEYANSELGGVLYMEAKKGNIRALEQWFDRRGGHKWKRITGQEHSGPEGGPIRYTEMTDEELDARLKQLTSEDGSEDETQAD
jgi:hypothetical protein